MEEVQGNGAERRLNHSKQMPSNHLKRTAIHQACVDGDLSSVIEFVDSGGSINEKDSNGWTALHYAVTYQHAGLVSYLLSKSPEVDAQDNHGNSPLWRAVFESRGEGEIIKLLIKNGANPKLINHYGVSPLELAQTIANYDVKQFFEEK